jgi:hypothetical protein
VGNDDEHESSSDATLITTSEGLTPSAKNHNANGGEVWIPETITDNTKSEQSAMQRNSVNAVELFRKAAERLREHNSPKC